jgi:hypothetical protein
MGLFKKGVMRTAWKNGKEAATKAAQMAIKAGKGNEYDLLFIKRFGDDFGPTLDKLEDLYPKKDAKANDYKAAWEKASKICNDYKKSCESEHDLSIVAQKPLLQALAEIRKLLDSKEVKP